MYMQWRVLTLSEQLFGNCLKWLSMLAFLLAGFSCRKFEVKHSVLQSSKMYCGFVFFSCVCKYSSICHTSFFLLSTVLTCFLDYF
jgi:hypothetical protein